MKPYLSALIMILLGLYLLGTIYFLLHPSEFFKLLDRVTKVEGDSTLPPSDDSFKVEGDHPYKTHAHLYEDLGHRLNQK